LQPPFQFFFSQNFGSFSSLLGSFPSHFLPPPLLSPSFSLASRKVVNGSESVGVGTILSTHSCCELFPTVTCHRDAFHLLPCSDPSELAPESNVISLLGYVPSLNRTPGSVPLCPSPMSGPDIYKFSSPAIASLFFSPKSHYLSELDPQVNYPFPPLCLPVMVSTLC